jgi:predicted metal-dependent hydrolase
MVEIKMKNSISRKLNLNFTKDIPKHWLGNSIFKSHLLNSFTLVFPAGEKFFIRSINKFSRQITDPKLKQDVKTFIRQESQHAVEHEKFFQNLRDQGYEIDWLVDAIESVIKKVLEPGFGAKMNLATTAGLEHFTALLAEIGLKENFLGEAHPIMKELFEWHAAEEIEHRSVAFDVLNAVDKSYALRLAGLINAYVLLSLFCGSSTIYLVAKDKKLLDASVLKDALDTLFLKEALFFKSLQICLHYLDPYFHPDNRDLDELSETVFGNGSLQGVG